MYLGPGRHTILEDIWIMVNTVGSSSKIQEYKQLINELRHGGAERFAKALELVPEIIEELVDKRLVSIKASIDELSGVLNDIRSLVEKIVDSIAELREGYLELNKRVSRLEATIGGLTEAMLSRIVVEELVAQGYRIKERSRNYRIDEEDIDLLVVAEKGKAVEHFLVGVKVKPSHSDVGIVLSKADLYEARTGVRPRPVLAGVWVGKEVEAYARSKGVEVVKL